MCHWHGFLLGFCYESIEVAGVLNPKWQGSSVSTDVQYWMIYDYLLDGMRFFLVLYLVCWSYLLGFIFAFIYLFFINWITCAGHWVLLLLLNTTAIFIQLLFATEILYYRKRQEENLLEGVKDWQDGVFWATHYWRFYNILWKWVLWHVETARWRKQDNRWT